MSKKIKPFDGKIRKNITTQNPDIFKCLKDEDYEDLKFPIIYDKKYEKYAVCFNEAEIPITEMSKSEIKFYVQFKKEFNRVDGKLAVIEYRDKLANEYFGGGY